VPRNEYRPSYGHYRAEVERLLAAGGSLSAVERMVERAPIGVEQRSALWLLAWATHDHPDHAESVALAPFLGDRPTSKERA
jgi:hypothetical protein